MIRNIILDYGGVIINLDYQKTSDAFKALGAKNFDEVFSQWKQTDIFNQLDIGKISEEEFFIKIKTELDLECGFDDIEKAWNAMLLDIPKNRYELLCQLKERFNLFLLSNTNTIHLKQISKYLMDTFQIADISVCFHKAYYSCYCGMRKPDIDFFKMVLLENNLDPHQTLFVDDNLQNIESANSININAKLLVAEELSALLERELK